MLRILSEEFKVQAHKFNINRLENQNKLALVGWLDGSAYGSYQTMTPYDLFISEEYNAVDVKSMFSDFGPKMFIEISDASNGKAKLTITSDMVYGLPASYWSMPFYLAGRSDNGGNTVFYYSDISGLYASPLVFDVEYSEDFSRLTIKAIDHNGTKFYPNVIGIYETYFGTDYILDYPIISDVVLTRGITKSAMGTSAPQKNVSVTPLNDELNISYKQHTRFEKPVERKTVEMEVMTMEKVQKNLEKYIQRLAR